MDSVNSAYIRHFDSRTILEISRSSLRYSQFDRSAPQSDDFCLRPDHLDPRIND